MVRLALLSALSDRADIGRISLIDNWEIEEPDTRSAVTILRKLKLTGSVLVVLNKDETDIALSFRNLPEARITTHAELSAHDVIRADWVLFSDRSLPTSVSEFSGTHERDEGETATDDTPAAKAPRTTKKSAAAVKDEAPAVEDAAPVENAEENETEETNDRA
jgi:large subunit ribosomal protein L4